MSPHTETPTAPGLAHAEWAECRVWPEHAEAGARALSRVGVVGGGTMGAGIAVTLLQGGLDVTLLERDEAALAQGLGRVQAVFAAQVAKGRLTPAEQDAVLARLQGSTRHADLAPADLVVEAVFEDMAIKQAVFAELSRVCRPDAILATNTSYLDVKELARSTPHPERVIGLHFFSPAHIMKLLEIVVPETVAPDVLATAYALARRLKKVPVQAGVCDGFIGNRILAVYRAAADHMMEDGASPHEIDQMARDFGYPMGPYEVSDLAGGDIGWATRQRRAATRDPLARYVPIADRLCERGWFGQKTGRGWYRYEAGSRQGQPCPEVLAIVEAERRRAGITPRAFTPAEMQRRYLAAMVNEAAKVLGDGIAQRPLDVDVVILHGYGFPRAQGGPLHWADGVGLPALLADIQSWARTDPLFWSPAPLLLALVQQGKTFASLNGPDAR